MEKNPLQNIKIAEPCTADWQTMIGNEQVKFCNQCNLNVYNLSGMTREAAESLIKRTEGRLCVRFYQRKDGTILTENCPVGLKALKQRLSRIATAAITAVLSFLGGIGIYTASYSESASKSYTRTMGTMVAPAKIDNSQLQQTTGQVVAQPPTGCQIKSVSLPVLNGPTVTMGRIAYKPQPTETTAPSKTR